MRFFNSAKQIFLWSLLLQVPFCVYAQCPSDLNFTVVEYICQPSNTAYDARVRVSGAPQSINIGVTAPFVGYNVSGAGAMVEDCFDFSLISTPCPPTISPVCACNGVTYDNAGCANQDGYAVVTNFPCDGTEEVEFLVQNIPNGAGLTLNIVAQYDLNGSSFPCAFTKQIPAHFCVPPCLLDVDYDFTPSTCGLPDGAISANATGTGNVSYNWSTSSMTNQITGLEPGTYYVTITDDNCQLIDTLILNAAGAPIPEWLHYFGGADNDIGSRVLMHPDGGYIIFGTTESTNGDVSNPLGNTDAWAVRVDVNGNLISQMTYGGPGEDGVADAIPTSDGGFVVVGSFGDVSSNPVLFDGWVFKINASGTLLWSHYYGGSDNDFLTCVQELPNGQIMVSGYTDSDDGDINGFDAGTDGWVMKLNADGTLGGANTWSRAYGSNDFDYATSIVLLPNGDFVIGGHSTGSGTIGISNGMSDIWVQRNDPNGNRIWSQLIGGSEVEISSEILLNEDGDLVLVGSSFSSNGDIAGNFGSRDLVSMRISTAGVLFGQAQNFGGSLSEESLNVNSLSDGGFLVSGLSSSNDQDLNTNGGKADMVLMKLNALGDMEWIDSYGGSEDDWASDAMPTPDGCYLVTGRSSSSDYLGQTNIGDRDLIAFKLCPADPPVVDLGPDQSSCEDDNIPLDATVLGCSSCTYLWDDSSTDAIRFVSPNSTQEYSVTVTNAAGCEASDTIIVNGRSNGVAELEGSYCDNEPGFEFFGMTYPLGFHTVILPIPAANGCDSVTLLTVRRFDSYNESIQITRCENDPPIEIGGQFFTTEDEYVIELTSINNCDSIINLDLDVLDPFAIILSPNGLVLDCTAPNVILSAEAASGGTYEWSSPNATFAGNPTDEIITVTEAGTYVLEVTATNPVDGATCVEQISVEVTGTGGSGISYTVNTTDATCGGSDGTATITNLVAQAPFTIEWPNMDTGLSSAGYGGGTYSVVVTDAVGCTLEQSFTINAGSNLSLSGMPSVLLCNGDSTGTIEVTLTGGTAPFTYTWTPDLGNIEDPMNLPAGTYSLLVEDADGCTIGDSWEIIQPATAFTVSAMVTNNDCKGDLTGSLALDVTGGTAPLTYTWIPNLGNVEDPTNLSGGTYALTITDALGCTIEDSWEITEPAEVLSATGIKFDSPCAGANEGSIALDVTGGTGPYDFMWTPDLGNVEDPTNLGAGTYDLTVVDAQGCSEEASFTITEPTDSIFLSATVTGTPCSGGAVGSIDVTPTGGSQPYTYAWTPAQGGVQDPTGLMAGTYTLTITDSQGCTKEESWTVGQIANSLSISGTPSATSCGVDDGIIQLTVSGGAQPYTYAWTPSLGGVEDPSGLSAGFYFVTVTDAEGCTIEDSFEITQSAGNVSLTGVVTSSACAPNSGSIDVTVTGGVGPYSFEWAPTLGNIEDPTGLGTGFYFVTATDDTGCTAEGSFQITGGGNPLVLTTSVTSDPCVSGIGSVSVAVTGGVMPYAYLWSDGSNQTTQEATNLSSGIYTVTVTDANNCTSEADVDLSSSILVDLGPDQQTCIGEPVTLMATLNTSCPSCTFTWSDGAVGATRQVTPTVNTTYTVTVDDGSGCSDSDEIEVVVGQPIDASFTIPANACIQELVLVEFNGPFSPSATFDFDTDGGDLVQSGTSLFQISWNTGGSKTVELIVDDRGCIDTAEAQIILIEQGLDAPVLNCEATGDSIIINWNAVAGATGYEVRINLGVWIPANQVLSHLISGLAPGQEVFFEVRATDVVAACPNGIGSITCTADGIAACNLTIIQAAVQVPTCVDGDDGMISVNIGGATGSVEFSLNAGPMQANNMFPNLSPGTYFLMVQDEANCQDTLTVELGNPDTIVVDEVITVDPTCNGLDDGVITVSASGGTGALTYEWSVDTLPDDPIAFDVTNGTYFVSITDQLGCQVVDTIILSAPDAIQATAMTTEPSCFNTNDGSLTFSATGGTQPYSYNWAINSLDGSAGHDTLSGGFYTITITDDQGCALVSSVLLQAPDSILIDLQATDPGCDNDDGSILAVASGGSGNLNYDWSGSLPDGNDEVTDLGGGMYSVIVIDGNGCTAEASTQIAPPNQIPFEVTSVNLDCFGDAAGEISIVPDGQSLTYDYDWADDTFDGQASANSLTAGDYNITITSAGFCPTVVPVTITQPDSIEIDLDLERVSCNGLTDGSALATVTGGTGAYTYEWSNGDSGTQMTDAAGDYSLIVTDANGCKETISFSIEEPDPLQLNETMANASCPGASNGSLLIEPMGGTFPFTYNWDNGLPSQPEHTNLPAGNYGLTVTDANGCTVAETFALMENDGPDPQLTGDTVLCDGETSTLSLTQSFASYLWEDQSMQPTLDVTTTGTYVVTITDSEGCTAATSIEVLVNALPNIDLGSERLIGCADTATVILSSGLAPTGLGFTWATADGQIQQGQGTPEIVVNAAGTYVLTAVNTLTNCVASQEVIVTQATVGLMVSSEPVSCNGDEDGLIQGQSVGGQGPFTYTLNGAFVQDQGEFLDLSAGNYNLQIEDALGCIAVENNIRIEEPGTLEVILPESLGGEFGTETVLTPEVNNAQGLVTYLWEQSNASTDLLSCPNCPNPTLSIRGDQTISLTVEDGLGCQASTEMTVFLDGVFIPEAITPGVQDGRNDIWIISGLEKFETNELIVINRWGDVVYEASPYVNDWDGTRNGKPLPEGTYYYTLRFDIDEGQIYKGKIVILR